MPIVPRSLALLAAVAAFAALPLQAADEATTPSVEIGIQNYRFEPAELQVKAGTTVRWINFEKRTSHSVLFTGEGSFESERMFPGESWEHLFDKPGIYLYTCGPHPEMKGRIEVTE